MVVALGFVAGCGGNGSAPAPAPAPPAYDASYDAVEDYTPADENGEGAGDEE